MKIGFIDKHLDEWHANNLPAWLREETEVEAIYAYEMNPNPNEGTLGGAEWAKKHDAVLCHSIEEVVEKSDAIMVLAPSFPELHEELARLPLLSGRPTYIDKIFAPSVENAKKIIDFAKKNGTPMFTTSALRYSRELIGFDKENIVNVNMRGPGPFVMYSIHQIEPIISLMGNKPKRLMLIGSEEHPAYIIEFSNGRFATAMHFDWDCPFNISVKYSDGKSRYVDACTDFFPGFIRELVKFFKTGEIPVDYDETIAVIGTLETLFASKEHIGEWIDIKL